MPVYNSELYVYEAIQSILVQTFSDFELLIFNDGSTDTSEKIILSITDKRISYFKNESNLGIIETRNLGLSQARGNYIAMMDSDDISISTRLEHQFQLMENNPSIGVCGAIIEFIGNRQGSFGYNENPVSTFTKLMTAPPFGQSTAFIRKSVLDKYSLKYNYDYPHAEDYKFWLDISKHSDIYCLPDTLVYYRWHTLNDSNVYQKMQQQSSRKVQKEWFEIVLNRRINKRESKYFEGNVTFSSCLYYNLLCFSVLKDPQIPVDSKHVIEQRTRVNRFVLNSISNRVIKKMLFPLLLLDKLISKMVVRHILNGRI